MNEKPSNRKPFDINILIEIINVMIISNGILYNSTLWTATAFESFLIPLHSSPTF